MDFNRSHMDEYGYGKYEYLPAEKLPNFYIAYTDDLSEGTEVFHNNIRQRFDQGDHQVHEAMHEFAEITVQFREALQKGDITVMNKLINRNFNLRASIFNISKRNWELINCARNVGASSKFCGSGGAIVGIYENEKMFETLQKEMERVKARIIKPIIFDATDR